jgi:hypothetical protein
MSKLRPVVWTAVLSAVFSFQTNASIIIYTDQSHYLNDLASYEYSVIGEGFESNEWASLRYPNTASSITVQDLTWSASDYLSTNNSIWTRSGTFGLFDSPGQPDGIYISSTPVQTIYGAAGWFNLKAAANINIFCDGVKVYTNYYPSGVGHEFFGAIKTDGIGTVAFTTKSGNFGADDFTFGVKKTTVPEPATIVLFLCGFMGLGIVNRKLKK